MYADFVDYISDAHTQMVTFMFCHYFKLLHKAAHKYGFLFNQ